MVYLRSISDGGFMMLPITFCAIVVVALAGWTALRTKAQDPGLGALAWDVIDGALFWGGYAWVLGVLGTVVGISIAAQAVEAVVGGSRHPRVGWNQSEPDNHDIWAAGSPGEFPLLVRAAAVAQEDGPQRRVTPDLRFLAEESASGRLEVE